MRYCSFNGFCKWLWQKIATIALGLIMARIWCAKSVRCKHKIVAVWLMGQDIFVAIRNLKNKLIDFTNASRGQVPGNNFLVLLNFSFIFLPNAHLFTLPPPLFTTIRTNFFVQDFFFPWFKLFLLKKISYNSNYQQWFILIFDLQNLT